MIISLCNDKYLITYKIRLNVVAGANFESPYLQRTNCTHPERISHTKMLLFSTEVFVSDKHNVHCSTNIYHIYLNATRTWIHTTLIKTHLPRRMYSFKCKTTCWEIFYFELVIVNAQNISDSSTFTNWCQPLHVQGTQSVHLCNWCLQLPHTICYHFQPLHCHSATYQIFHCTGYTALFKLPHSCFWWDPYHAMITH